MYGYLLHTMQIQQLIADFEITRILKIDPQTKSLAVLGKIQGQDAIIHLEKTSFAWPEHQVDVAKAIEKIRLIESNDIYFWSLANLRQSLQTTPGAKVNVIFPATETHINKYAFQKLHYITETKELYEKTVKPYIETQKGDRIQWVHNILFHGKEADTFIHHDEDPIDGFVLLPDMKWDRISVDALYLIAIVKRMDIASVRDLNGSHLPFLEKLLETVKTIASSKYPVDRDGLRVFIHYQPSYYHFHVHVVNVAHPGLGDGINVGKAILMDDVIENLKLAPDYYQKRTLFYVLGENHGLWKALQQ